MKKLLLTIMTVLLATLAAQSSNYEINVGGVEVTTSNYNNVTGGDISGTVSYNPSTNTLTLTNVSIYRTGGSGNYAIHNRACNGLKVRLVGDNYLYSKDGPAIKVNSGNTTTFQVEGGDNTIYSLNNDAIFEQSNSNYNLSFRGYGYVNIKSGKTYGMRSDAGCICVMGNLSSQNPQNPLKVDIYGPLGDVRWDHQMVFYYDCIVNLKKTGVYDNPNVVCGKLGTTSASAGTFYYAKIFDPQGAVVNSARTTIIRSSVPVYNDDIIIASDNIGYKVTINSTNFPDENFRNYLLGLYPKGYLTQTDIDNRTSLSCSNKGISSLTGIKYFTALQDLRCYNNNITSLDLSYNTSLTYLDCDGNGMTSLNVNNCTALTYLDCGPNNLTSLNLSNLTALKTLFCNQNKLTSLSLAPSTPNLEQVSCYNNSFTSFSLTGRPALKILDISNCTSMTSLACNNNKLSSLSVTGNTALKTLKCYGSNHTLTTLNLSGTTGLTYLDCAPNYSLTSIQHLENCTDMRSLYCYGTALTDLNAVTSMSSLEVLSCHDTNISELYVPNKSTLTTLYCYNCPNLTAISCQNCALTTFECQNCPALATLYCWNNQFITINVTNNTALTYLDCGPNSSLTNITGLGSCTAMKTLICYDTQITDLSAVSGMTNLEALRCYNTKLTTLTVQNKSRLTQVTCYGIPTLISLTVTGNPSLSALNCSSCTELKTLYCYNNTYLSYLYVSGNTAMTSLRCYGNSDLSSISGVTSCTNLTEIHNYSCNFSSFDATPFTKLQVLHCHNNKLTSLDVSGKTSLTELYCYENQLTSLNVQGCSALSFLSTGGNNLTSLNVQGCNSLYDLRCHGNKITESGMNTLINSLPTRPSSSWGMLGVWNYLSYDEQNVITAAQITAAKSKHWSPKQWTNSGWMDISIAQPGDINGDGVFNITDVTELTYQLLNGDVSASDNPAADYNGDGVVNISDVTDMIYNLLNN